MPDRTLIATMGFDERHVLPALRLLPYDRLVLVAGGNTFHSPGFRTLRSLEPNAQVVRVDAFDFADCLETIQGIVRLAEKNGPVRMTVTGGTKILAMAAVLAAFQQGIEAWYCDPNPIRLPVLRGVRFTASFPPAEVAVIRSLRREVSLDALVSAVMGSAFARRTILGAIHSLAGAGLVELENREGRTTIRPSPALSVVRVHLGAEPEKA